MPVLARRFKSHTSLLKAFTITLSLLTSFFFSAASHASFDFGSANSSSFGELESDTSDPSFLSVDQAFIFQSSSDEQALKFNWQISDGYYLYQSKIKLDLLSPNATIGDPVFSDMGVEENDPYFGITRVVHNSLELTLPITLLNDATDAEIAIEYQGCATAGLCYPPQTKTVLFVPSSKLMDAQPGSQVAQTDLTKTNENIRSEISRSDFDGSDASSIFAFMQTGSFITLAAVFFALGLGLTFTPCVLPMIPIITSIVAGPNSNTSRFTRNLTLALSYVLGMSLTYATLGLTVGILGAGANLQAAMQSPTVLITFSTVFALLACSMFGLYDIQLPSFIRDRLETKSQNLKGGAIVSVFLIGAFSAILVSPCVSAPLAGALIYISTSGDAALGFIALLSLGLGMGVPLILVAVGGARFLPKSGAWLNISKVIFGALLLAVAIWLLARIIPEPLSLGLWAVLALGVGVYLITFKTIRNSASVITKTLGSLAIIVAAIWMLGAFSGAGDPLNPLNKLTLSPNTQSSVAFEFHTVGSLSELDAELAKAGAEGKKAFLDIYADWCISCIIMEREVFPLDNIAPLLSQFYLIKADVTKNSADNIALLEHFELFGPPSYLFFDRNSDELRTLRIAGEISEDGFESRLTSALSTN